MLSGTGLMLVSCFPVGLSTAQGLFCMTELHSQNYFSLGPLYKTTFGPPAGCLVPFPLAVRACLQCSGLTFRGLQELPLCPGPLNVFFTKDPARLRRREHPQGTCVKPWLCLEQLLGIHLEDSGLRDWRQAGWAHLPSTDRLMEGPAAP